MAVGCQESLEERCEREAREYTEKHCPTPVAKDVVMDSMTFDKATHTITYAYTLTGQLDDSAVVEGAHSRDLLLQEIKNSAWTTRQWWRVPIRATCYCRRLRTVPTCDCIRRRAIASAMCIIRARKKERSC